MAEVHCVGDQRTCGANTVAQGNQTVYVGDKLWAVKDDPDTHGAGGLIPGLAATVSIHDLEVIVVGDHAHPDNAMHPDPAAATGSSTVSAGN